MSKDANRFSSNTTSTCEYAACKTTFGSPSIPGQPFAEHGDLENLALASG